MTVRTATRVWPLWSTTATLVIAGPAASDPAAIDRALFLADQLLGELDAACNRFRRDSELSRVSPHLPAGVTISPLLTRLVGHALDAAALTGGAVDPTLGHALDAAGYDRDIRLIEDSDRIVRVISSPRPGWRSVTLSGDRLRVPGRLALDLGATAKAYAADMVATRIAQELGGGVLLSIGGDIGSAGDPPDGGWRVTVQDLPTDPAARIRLRAGRGMATSSTQKRRWHRGGKTQHHILDPRTGLPAEAVWRSVTVAAASCLRANTFSTAAVVRGRAAVAWLDALGIPARFVDREGRVAFAGDWPADAELGHRNTERGAA